MESIPKNSIFKFNSDTLVSLRKLYGLEKPGRIDDAIDILVEWLKKQEHFKTKEFSREYLERAIIISKGSVERAKLKLEKSCTFKTLCPIFYEPFDIRNSYLTDNFTGGFLPNLTKDHYRVYIFKNWGLRKESGLLDYYRYMLMVCEYIQAHDYCNGTIGIFDYYDVSLMDIVKLIDIVELRQAMSIIIEGYGMRIKGLHFLTTSKTVDLFLSIFKQVVSPKISDRIHFHKNIDTLFDYVPKENMPSEYGGNEIALKKICGNLLDEITSNEFMDYFNKMKDARTDEDLRSQAKFNEQCMGMPGSFRKLNVD